jgi:hypothetical protein
MICFANTSLARLGENRDERESPEYKRPDLAILETDLAIW